jgi:excisionase family DNA binding protein
MTSLADLPAVLTVEETAELLRIGRSAAYEGVRAGEIPSIRVGRCIRVPKHRLEQLLGEVSPNDVKPGGQPGSTQNGVTAPHGTA